MIRLKKIFCCGAQVINHHLFDFFMKPKGDCVFRVVAGFGKSKHIFDIKFVYNKSYDCYDLFYIHDGEETFRGHMTNKSIKENGAVDLWLTTCYSSGNLEFSISDDQRVQLGKSNIVRMYTDTKVVERDWRKYIYLR